MPAVRPSFHLTPCSKFRSHLSARLPPIPINIRFATQIFCDMTAEVPRKGRLPEWVKSGKVQTEQMFSDLCLKADAAQGVSNIR
jgi:hypothetical protein